MDIKDRIKTFRLKNNETQEDLANILHISRQTISSWENGRTYPNIDILVKISTHYNVSLDDLIKGDSAMVDKLSITIKKSKFRKIIIICLSILLVFIIGFNCINIAQNYQKNEQGLSPSDLTNTNFKLTYDPKNELIAAYLDFSNKSITVFKKYKTVATPYSTPESISQAEIERKKAGKIDENKTYEDVKIKVIGDQYIVTGYGFKETYTRIDKKRIKDNSGVEYIK